MDKTQLPLLLLHHLVAKLVQGDCRRLLLVLPLLLFIRALELVRFVPLILTVFTLPISQAMVLLKLLQAEALSVVILLFLDLKS